MNETELNVETVNTPVANAESGSTSTDVSVSKPWMSVVIPAYNCRNEIERLLDSIVIQNWSKNELEVIICDDNSTDNFMELVAPYTDKLTIRYFKTEPRDVHCPGNTRRDGLSHVTGTWVTFIDNDDMFEPGAFDMIRNHVEATKESRMVFTLFREWIAAQFNDEGVDTFGRVFDGNTWLHGNWYNVDWLKANNIGFKEGLESHEDLYFNCMCNVMLLKDSAFYSIPEANAAQKQFAYRWIFRPNSLSRSYFSTDHYYIETYLRDYIYAGTEPWLYGFANFCKDGAHPEWRQYFLSQCVYTVLYSFFYWESGYYRLGDKVLPENISYIKDVVDRICFRFHISRTDIINAVYSRPDEYMRIKSESFSGGGIFVELHTFRDFMLSI